MKNKAIAAVLIMILSSVFGSSQSPASKASDAVVKGLCITFEGDQYPFKEEEKRLFKKIIVQSEQQVRTVLPTLPKDIRVRVTIIDRKVDFVGGVTGRADSNSPAEILLEISNVYPGGVIAAGKIGLAKTVFHELHHLSRGWAIKDNKFEQGISIAAVNEGLAVVFAEKYSGVEFEANSYSEGVDKWVKEIMALPKNADYGTWMFEHPDGRTSIGYRAGKYIIHQAIAKSGKDILELSKLSPAEILELADIK